MDFWDLLWHFKPEEFQHPNRMDKRLLTKLDSAREYAGIPFRITSDWREDSLEHEQGKAVDIAVEGSYERRQIVVALIRAGIPRIGVYDRHIHAGVSQDLPAGIWPGVSQ